MDKINLVEKSQLKRELTKFKVGDTIKVWSKIKEQDKIRLQPFEGTVIRMRGEGLRRSFSVRKISYGEGIERTFPLHSPSIEKIDLVRSGKVRRAKLYYLRKRVGKKARVKEEVSPPKTEKPT